MDRNALMSVNPLAYGMHDVTDRGSFLPLGRYPYGYDLAWPQPVADMGNTLLSVMRGQPVAEDIADLHDVVTKGPKATLANPPHLARMNVRGAANLGV